MPVTLAALCLLVVASCTPVLARNLEDLGAGQLDALRAEGRRLAMVQGEFECDDGVIDYISGSKVNVSVIPYSDRCILKYQELGHVMALPNTVAVHMTGNPKTGTTWTEVFAAKMLEEICKSGIYKGCKYDLTYRGSMITIPAGRNRLGKVIRFNTFLKHDPFFDWKCAGFTQTPEKSASGCHMYKFQDTEIVPPDWEQCIYRTPYTRIKTCIPEYMQVQKDLPVMDNAANEVSEQKKTLVDMTGAVRKYIHVIRDPRDAALSWVHYHGVTDRKEIDTKVKEVCNHYIAWTAFYYYWQMEAYGEVFPSMELYYRKLMDQPFKEYTKTMEWFGLRASVVTLQKILAETDMGAMKQMEKERVLPGRNHAGKADAKVRQGGYGNFMSELSQDTVEKCTEAMKLMLPEQMLRIFRVIDKDLPWAGPPSVNPLL